MRTLFLFPIALAALELHAQDWAVIRPGLKYNYALGGTDTITSQLFTTQVDTLGPDSFRYTLDLIGKQCDTCTTALGGPCDGCYLIAGQPQFLGAHILHGPSGDRIAHNGQYLWLRGDATLGSTWSYDGTVAATVTDVVQGEWQGQLDSIKTIGLSDGGTILLSRSFGLISFPDEAGDQRLIGNQTLGVGRTIPDLFAMFPYQPGDILQYHTEHIYSDYPTETNEYRDLREKLTCTARSEQGGVLHLAFDVIGHLREYDTHFTNVTMDVDSDLAHATSWDLPGTALPFADMAFSYPGQFMPADAEAGLHMIARHGLDDQGRYVMEAARYGSATPFIYGASEIVPGIYPMFSATHHDGTRPEEVRYVEGVGLEHFRFDVSGGPAFTVDDLQLEGAVIGGDTIGHVDPDGVILSVEDDPNIAVQYRIVPNPVSDRLVVQTDAGSLGVWQVLDAAGRSVAQGNATGNTVNTIDVSGLSEGLYLLNVATPSGPGAQRFVVAR